MDKVFLVNSCGGWVLFIETFSEIWAGGGGGSLGLVGQFRVHEFCAVK